MRTYIDWLTEAKGVKANVIRLGNELRERWSDWKNEAPYATWEECCQAEVGISASTLRRLNYKERNPEARNHKRSPGNGTEAGTGTDRTEDSENNNSEDSSSNTNDSDRKKVTPPPPDYRLQLIRELNSLYTQTSANILRINRIADKANLNGDRVIEEALVRYVSGLQNEITNTNNLLASVKFDIGELL